MLSQWKYFHLVLLLKPQRTSYVRFPQTLWPKGLHGNCIKMRDDFRVFSVRPKNNGGLYLWQATVETVVIVPLVVVDVMAYAEQLNHLQFITMASH